MSRTLHIVRQHFLSVVNCANWVVMENPEQEDKRRLCREISAGIGLGSKEKL